MGDAIGLHQKHPKGSDSNARALGIERSSVHVLPRRVMVHDPCDLRVKIKVEVPRGHKSYFGLRTRQGRKEAFELRERLVREAVLLLERGRKPARSLDPSIVVKPTGGVTCRLAGRALRGAVVQLSLINR